MNSSVRARRIQSKDVQVMVVGAGVVGASLALALAQQFASVNVLLVERNTGLPSSTLDPKNASEVEKFDSRILALNTASTALLKRLQVWDAIVEQRCLAYRHMCVWDAEGTGSIQFGDESHQASSHQAEDSPILGTIVETARVQAVLWRALDQQPNVQWIKGDVVAEVSELDTEHKRLVTLQSGQCFALDMLCIVDGTSSATRELLKFPVVTKDYEQSAIVAQVNTELSHKKTAWQIFRPEGPLAFLPLPTNNMQASSIVWTVSSLEAERLMSLDDSRFSKELSAAFEYRLGEAHVVSQRLSFPLFARQAEIYIKPGAVLLGDSAHHIHPLAGQGANLGIADVENFLAQFSKAILLEQPLALSPYFRRYQRQRRAENSLMLHAMSAFKLGFGSRNQWLKSSRNLGLNIANSSALKTMFGNYANGSVD